MNTSEFNSHCVLHISGPVPNINSINEYKWVQFSLCAPYFWPVLNISSINEYKWVQFSRCAPYFWPCAKHKLCKWIQVSSILTVCPIFLACAKHKLYKWIQVSSILTVSHISGLVPNTFSGNEFEINSQYVFLIFGFVPNELYKWK